MANWRKEHIGSDRPYKDGERFMKLRLVEVFPYSDGSGHCYRFADNLDRCVVLFSRRKRDWEIGAFVQARFVVKSHRVYKDGVWESVVKSFSVLEHA